MSRNRQIDLEDILAAAMRVITRDGLGSLTIDATAKEAGVSKGGVLYSYRTKDDLLRALVKHALTLLDRDIEERMAADPEPAGRWMRAYIASACSPGRPWGAAVPPGVADAGTDHDRLFSALFAAVAADRNLLDATREMDDRWAARIASDGVDVVENYITMLAVEGLNMGRLLGKELPKAVSDAVVRRLHERTRTGPAAAKKKPKRRGA